MTTQVNKDILLEKITDINLDKRSLTYHQIILCSVVIGIVGGLVATIYYFVSVLSGTAMLPVIGISSFVSFLLTTELSMLKTQRSRDMDELYSAQKLRQQKV